MSRHIFDVMGTYYFSTFWHHEVFYEVLLTSLWMLRRTFWHYNICFNCITYAWRQPRWLSGLTRSCVHSLWLLVDHCVLSNWDRILVRAVKGLISRAGILSRYVRYCDKETLNSNKQTYAWRHYVLCIHFDVMTYYSAWKINWQTHETPFAS